MAEIRKSSSVDGGELRRFYADAFPDRAEFLSAHWRWLYRVGEFPGIEPLVLVDGSRVVGHAGAIPFTLAHAGKAETAIWFVDFSIVPELQGKGHGKALTEAWMALCPRRVTFCNDLSIRVFLKLGWAERAGARVLSQPFELSAPLSRRFGPLGAMTGKVLNAPSRAVLGALASGAPAASVIPLPDDAAALSVLLDDRLAPSRVARDAAWIKWRLLDNPRRSELLLAQAGGVAAVFRLFESLDRRRAHLLLVGPGPGPARAAMAESFTRWALDEGVDDAWLAGNDETVLAAAAPVLRRARPLRFAWHGAGSDAPLVTQGIDSDHDLMFP